MSPEIFLAFAVGVLLGNVVGVVVMNLDWRSDAVRNGKAEYYIDEHYRKRWRWKL